MGIRASRGPNGQQRPGCKGILYKHPLDQNALAAMEEDDDNDDDDVVVDGDDDMWGVTTLPVHGGD